MLRRQGWSSRFVYGVDYVRNSISNLYTGQAPLPPEAFPLKRFPDTHEISAGLYAQNETVVGNWTITPGLRIDHFRIDVQNQDLYFPPAPQPAKDMSGSAFLPKLGLLYRATPEWSVFGQYATGYRAPEAGQVNDRFQAKVGVTNNIIIANPEPEARAQSGHRAGLAGPHGAPEPGHGRSRAGRGFLIQGRNRQAGIETIKKIAFFALIETISTTNSFEVVSSRAG